MSCCGLNCWNFQIIFTVFSPDVRIVACSALRSALPARGVCITAVRILTKFGTEQSGEFTL